MFTRLADGPLLFITAPLASFCSSRLMRFRFKCYYFRTVNEHEPVFLNRLQSATSHKFIYSLRCHTTDLCRLCLRN